MKENYKIKDEIPDKEREKLAQYGELLSKLLYNRGIKEADEAGRFLNPDYERDTHDPFLILNMERAVDRIIKGIDEEEKIVIYGDYDCDGIPGSVILHDFFKKIGYKNFLNYIPHRNREGYGLNRGAVEQFARDGFTLIITVDCGITDVEEVALANELGIDVIITDHHLPQAVLPDAYAVINSKQEGDTYPDNMLCGAGVAFKLVQALLSKGREKWKVPTGWEKWLLDMAGLSTIADMVPLVKENRALAHFGISVLRKSRRPGFQKLLRKMFMDQRYVTEDDIAFMIAPRINAASRLDVPFEAFRLLSTNDETIADELSSHLQNINEGRKGMVLSIMKEVKQTMEKRELREIIVIGNPSWKPGVAGLVATRLVEEYDRPVFVWGSDENNTHLKGSCRSDGTVNLVELMVSVPTGTFLDVGGHEFSGGFSVSHEAIHFLEDTLVSAYLNLPKKEKTSGAIEVDAELTLDQVTRENYKHIEKLAPFGVGNHKPTFIFRNVVPEEVRAFGKGKNHLEIVFKNEKGNSVSAIGFFSTADGFQTPVEAGTPIDMVATFEKSMYRGIEKLRLRIVDIFPKS
jgi:single-stranded-DNA-specific exonuclease